MSFLILVCLFISVLTYHKGDTQTGDWIQIMMKLQSRTSWHSSGRGLLFNTHQFGDKGRIDKMLEVIRYCPKSFESIKFYLQYWTCWHSSGRGLLYNTHQFGDKSRIDKMHGFDIVQNRLNQLNFTSSIVVAVICNHPNRYWYFNACVCRGKWKALIHFYDCAYSDKFSESSTYRNIFLNCNEI